MALSWRLRFGYAIGHVLNDLCASVWFTYTLVYFKFGVGVPTILAGTVVLLGQVADGLATPLVGYFSDRTSSRQVHFPVHYQRTPTEQESNGHVERTLYPSESTTELIDDVTVRSPSRLWTWFPRGRKAWHFVGSLLVITSFPLLFGSPFATHHVSTWAKMIYYSPIVILFQVSQAPFLSLPWTSFLCTTALNLVFERLYPFRNSFGFSISLCNVHILLVNGKFGDRLQFAVARLLITLELLKPCDFIPLPVSTSRLSTHLLH